MRISRDAHDTPPRVQHFSAFHCNVVTVLGQDQDVFEPPEAFGTSADPVHSLISSEDLHFVDKCGKDLWLASLQLCRDTMGRIHLSNR